MTFFDDPKLCERLYRHQENEIVTLKKRVKHLEQALSDADKIFRERYKDSFALLHEPYKHDNPEFAQFDPPPLPKEN